MSHSMTTPPRLPKRLVTILFLCLILLTIAILGVLGLLTTEILDILVSLLRVATQVLIGVN